MTMTDNRGAREHAFARAGYGTQAHVDKARAWLVESGIYTEAETAGFNTDRIVTALNRLYTGGWGQFLADTVTVEQAIIDATSEAAKWELSW
jgi:hypothetical protein